MLLCNCIGDKSAQADVESITRYSQCFIWNLESLKGSPQIFSVDWSSRSSGHFRRCSILETSFSWNKFFKNVQINCTVIVYPCICGQLDTWTKYVIQKQHMKRNNLIIGLKSMFRMLSQYSKEEHNRLRLKFVRFSMNCHGERQCVWKREMLIYREKERTMRKRSKKKRNRRKNKR